jgi:hypothetical protein
MGHEALKLALDALKANVIGTSGRMPKTHEAITAIKEALAQPAQEPDAYQSGFYDGKKAARARCIELVLSGTGEPVQTRTLEILQQERKRIAKLIEEDGKP